jgi:predicted RNA-binding protein Jag
MAGSVYEGKTFDEAVRKGLEALRLSRAEAVIITIEEGKGGFLGIGARPYRVSVARRPGGVIREPAERDERRGGRRPGREERTGRGGREAHGRGARDERTSREERGGRANREERAPRGKREERGVREERGARPAREERVAREDRPAKAAKAPREERVAREERPEREAREPREARGGRNRAPREERQAEPAASGAPAPSAVGETGGDATRKRRRRGRRGGRGRRRGAGAEGAEAPAPTGLNGTESLTAEPRPVVEKGPIEHTPHAEVEAMPAPHPAPAAYDDDAEDVEPVESYLTPVEAAPEPVGAPSLDVTRRDAGRRDEGRHEARRERFRGREREPREGSGAPDMSTDELVTTSRKLTEDLLRAMGFEPKVEVRAEGNRVDVTVEVERDEQLLVGRQGETRQALQHLLNRFLNKGDGSRYHLQLEVNDFWQQREGELAELARGMADDAVNRNAEVVSDYLNSQERRIVHMTLREDARVRTFSLGTGMVKRVAVAPASFPERTEDDIAS